MSICYIAIPAEIVFLPEQVTFQKSMMSEGKSALLLANFDRFLRLL